MRTRIELFILWFMEAVMSLFKWVAVLAFWAILTLTPIIELTFGLFDINKNFCVLWITVVYLPLLILGVGCYYKYLTDKYRKNVNSTNDEKEECQRGVNMYWE